MHKDLEAIQTLIDAFLSGVPRFEEGGPQPGSRLRARAPLDR